jgi:2-aminoadipate transaminase
MSASILPSKIELNPKLSQRSNMVADQPIGKLMHQALAYPNLISLAAGFVDYATLPTSLTADAFQRLSANEGTLKAALQYGSTQGDAKLRKAILQFAYRHDGMANAIDPDRVLVTSGSNQLLHMLSDCLFDPGDIVLTTAPTYFVYLGVLNSLGVRSVGIESDEHGMCSESLKTTLDLLRTQGYAERVKAVYIVPEYDNPRGITMGTERRKAIGAVLDQWRETTHPVWLIADYAYQELGYYGEEIPTFRSLNPSWDASTIEAGTFSKSFSPGVRVGWGVFPESLVEPINSQKANIDFGSPNLNQQLILDVLENADIEQHLQVIRDGYRSKLESTLRSCEKHLGPISGVRWTRPTGGLYVWVELPEGMPAGPDSELFRQAVKSGVLYVPGEYCFPSEGTHVRYNSMRLTFGVQTPDRIELGIKLLADAIQNCLKSAAK